MSESKWTTKQIPNQSGRVAIVTGANSGLGFETSRALAARGAEVVMACRNLSKGEEAIAKISAESPDATLVLMQLDLSSLDSVATFAEAFRAKYARLDLLINNAGVMAIPYAETAEGFEMQFGVNHLGHFALTGRLIDLLLATPDSRIVSVSSNFHRFGSMNFDDLNSQQGYSRWQAYGQSKLANLLFTYELQRRLSQLDTNTIAVAGHPGYSATNLSGDGKLVGLLTALVAQSAEMGALPQLYAATAPDVVGGEYFGPDGFMSQRGYPERTKGKDEAYDPVSAERLWTVSETMTGVTYDALKSTQPKETMS